MPYPGGKAGAGVFQRIINQIPRHDVYIEPFLGDAAVLRRKLPARRTVAIEIDPEVAEYFAAEFHGPDRAAALGGVADGLEVHNCCGIQWLKHAFGLYRIVSADGASFAAREQPPDPTPPDPAAAAAAALKGDGGRHALRDPDARLRDGRSTFVYLDPPYLLSTRRSSRPLYRFEMTEAQHIDLLETIRRLPCPVAISGYWSPLYAEALEPWRVISFTTMTRRNQPAREYLWMNYPAPAELHDYRYLGEEKRERERIARKVRTWAAGLQRLPPLEREAILAALDKL